ncbi:MAG: EF-hand domain-containing protein [Sphingomonadales bacterium]|nr:EF-hand domain-containing protein [Sphingomonadales bacterium]
MLKTILLASAMAVSVPVMAQDTPQQASSSATTQSSQDATAAPQTDTAPQGAPIAGAPVNDPAPAPQANVVDDAGTATTPDDGANQVAQVVSTEFPTYDKNADKSLDKAEFGQWMVALKSASDRKTKASDPATKAWVDGAFASADTDKSKSVSQAELTTYLSQGAG